MNWYSEHTIMQNDQRRNHLELRSKFMRTVDRESKRDCKTETEEKSINGSRRSNFCLISNCGGRSLKRLIWR